jgi:hypothetical protein
LFVFDIALPEDYFNAPFMCGSLCMAPFWNIGPLNQAAVTMPFFTESVNLCTMLPSVSIHYRNRQAYV